MNVGVPKALSLALRMQELNRWLSAQEGSAGETHEFFAMPHGNALVTIDPTSEAPAASYNRNRIALCGARGGLTQDGLRELLDMFASRRIPRVFAWLSPGPDDALVRDWLHELRWMMS